ncbi:MAG: hypothetical protein H6644_15900 [Caldilineaceae bacterium]|nr:hypothetical protein [Caldilineaceae bacterium]
MSEKLVISIDSSTTACKAIAWDRAGNAVAEGRASYPMLQPQPTWGEQDAEDWWRSTCTALRECAAQVDASKIEALGITHQRESFVPVDADGRPLRNAILWLDERSRRQVAWMSATFGRDALHQLTGKPPSMTQSLPKIIWLVEHEPDVMQRASTRSWTSTASWSTGSPVSGARGWPTPIPWAWSTWSTIAGPPTSFGTSACAPISLWSWCRLGPSSGPSCRSAAATGLPDGSAPWSPAQVTVTAPGWAPTPSRRGART